MLLQFPWTPWKYFQVWKHQYAILSFWLRFNIILSYFANYVVPSAKCKSHLEPSVFCQRKQNKLVCHRLASAVVGDMPLCENLYPSVECSKSRSSTATLVESIYCRGYRMNNVKCKSVSWSCNDASSPVLRKTTFCILKRSLLTMSTW